MILVTGAGGKTGKAVLRSLGSENRAVRALVKSEGQVPPETGHGARETVVADLLSLAEMTRAMAEVQAVYLIAPNMHPEEVRISEVAIAAARDAGVRRIVYHSVLHPQTQVMPHHWQKLAVEERLFASGLDFTILQPAAYMQNVLAFWDEIVEKGVYRVPYGESAALSLVDLDDVATVAADVLTSGGHTGATYELAGPEPLTPGRIADVLSRHLNRDVISEAIPLEQWVAGARATGLKGYPLDSLIKMFEYYDRHGLAGNPRVLEMLLGRPPTSFPDFVERVVAA